jgi:hypothetical protein
MRKILVLIGMFAGLTAFGQAETTQALQKKYEDGFVLFFYKNTLRMLNQSENKEFDELVSNIEKLKFLMIEKKAGRLAPTEYRKIKTDYKSEAYESVMNARYEGRDMEVFIRDKRGEKLRTVILVNDSTNLMVLDMIGTIDVTKAGSLFSMIDSSTEVSERLKSFTKHKKGKDDEKDNEESDH